MKISEVVTWPARKWWQAATAPPAQPDDPCGYGTFRTHYPDAWRAAVRVTGRIPTYEEQQRALATVRRVCLPFRPASLYGTTPGNGPDCSARCTLSGYCSQGTHEELDSTF